MLPLKQFLTSRTLAILVAVASIVFVIATYLAIANSSGIKGVSQPAVLALVLMDLILLLALAVIIARRLVRLIIQQRQGIAGSRLQTRIVLMFSLVAMVPAIIMAISSAVFFNYGIQAWFNQKVSAAIDGSVDIAQSYLEEHKKIIRSDVMGMANDLNRDVYNIRKNPRSLAQKLSFLAVLRKLPEAIIFQRNDYGNINLLASTSFSFSLQLELEDLSADIFSKADQGELVTLTTDNEDRVMALISLDNFFDTYLLVGRFVDNKIINYIETTEGAASEYNLLKNNISSLQIKFFIVFIIVSLLVLLVTAWVGFMFAVYLVKPVNALLVATERVKIGDLSARVAEGHADDEMATLSRAFNSMAEQLDRQRRELISAQRRSAWADVARRIAHEIKNPLTPIQLAAERLQRKYSDKVEDQETFNKYLTTISRNVGSIGNMVDEFASFARIPAPVFSSNNICELVKEAVFAREGVNKGIVVETSIPENPLLVNCDAGQVAQVLTNLLKNAEEAIIERKAEENKNWQGLVKVNLSIQGKHCNIEIIDNGKGFPDEIRDRITEPYVTTKSKGTGLGLAIVKKIVEDHAGNIEFKNINGGACVYLGFPLQQKEEQR